MLSTDRPISEVLKDIFGNFQELIRSEVRLAKTELRQDFAKIRHAAIWLAVGSLLGTFSLFFIYLVLFFGLLYLVPEWAAAAIIALALGIICVIAFNAAGAQFKKLKQSRSSPSAAQLKENIEWTNQQVK